MLGLGTALYNSMLKRLAQLTDNCSNATWWAVTVFNLVPVNNMLQIVKTHLLMVDYTVLERWVPEPITHDTTELLCPADPNTKQGEPMDLCLFFSLSKNCYQLPTDTSEH